MTESVRTSSTSQSSSKTTNSLTETNPMGPSVSGETTTTHQALLVKPHALSPSTQERPPPFSSSSSSDSTSYDPWQASSRKNQLLETFWTILHDDIAEFHDIHLISSQGDKVSAARFVLAARSRVLKRMLYGSFRESQTNTINMMGYETHVLQAVVEYCQTNQLPAMKTSVPSNTPPARQNNNNNSNNDTTSPPPPDVLESIIRQRVRLYHAADFLELPGLVDLVHWDIRRLMGIYPGLSCVVLDEVDDPTSPLGEYARLLMEVRPYEALGANDMTTTNTTNESDQQQQQYTAVGGIECLRLERLQMILQSPNIMCGELFLFRILQQWYDSRMAYLGDHYAEEESSHQYETEATLLVELAVKCAKLIRLENIEPAALISMVQPCPFVSPAFLYDAFAKQALRASENRVWTINCRPHKYQSVERVLVEDCGNRQAAGLYVRMVAGLKKTHASIFTKREVVAGQAIVYTLSCSVTPSQQVECRIFCSPLLTPQAIPTLVQFHAANCVDPLFQPILQVVAMKDGNDKKVVVSDGYHCMQATMANDMVIQSKKSVQKHGVLQVLAFRLYNGTESTKIHIQKASVVTSNAGQVFGQPQFYTARKALLNQPYDQSNDLDLDSPVPDIEDDCDLPSNVLNTSVDECSTFAGTHHAAVKDSEHVTKLYSCTYPLKEQPRHCRVPKDGWKSESPSLDPAPTCTWFPAVKRASKSSSSSTVVSVNSGLSLTLTKPSRGNPPKKISAGAASLTSSYSPSSGSAIDGNASTIDELQSLGSSVLEAPSYYPSDSILDNNDDSNERTTKDEDAEQDEQVSTSSGVELCSSSSLSAI